MTVAAKKQDDEAGIKLGYQITLRRLGELEPFAANARTHSADQVAEIAASIAEYGWTNPILADGSGGIVAGHGRRLAAIQIYDAGGTIRLPSGEQIPAGMVPVIDCTGWTAKQKRAYVLADNQLALKADWDLSLLRQEIEGLRDDGVDLKLTGFDVVSLGKTLGAGAGTNAIDEWRGMPQYSHEDKTAYRTIPIHFACQNDVERFAEIVGQKITPKTRSMWFPAAVVEAYADKSYTADEP